MLTHRLRRRRHSLDTYIHEELEGLASLTENAPVPLRPSTPDAVRKVATEKQFAGMDQSGRLSA